MNRNMIAAIPIDVIDISFIIWLFYNKIPIFFVIPVSSMKNCYS